MRKKILLTIGGIVLLVIIYLFTSPKSSQKSPFPSFNPTPTSIGFPTGSIGQNTPTPSVTISQEPLSILGVTPPDQTTNVPVNTAITIGFSRNFSANEITFSIGPNVSYTSKISGSTLTITPNLPLLPGATYQYVIQFSDGSFSQKYSFTTAGQNDNSNNPNYDNTNTLQNDWYKSFKPDVFLANKTPYQGSDFSVTYDFTDIPNEHYFFIVTTSSNQGQQDFLSWLKSLGLTDNQIQQLEIHYQ